MADHPSPPPPEEPPPPDKEDNDNESVTSEFVPDTKEVPIIPATKKRKRRAKDDYAVIIPPTFNDEIESVRSLPYHDAAEKLFPKGRVFDNHYQLQKMMNIFGGQRGFSVSLNGYRVVCPRFGSRKYIPSVTTQSTKHKNDSLIRHRGPNSMKCGCEFVIYFSGKSGKDKVQITKAHYKHTNGCTPSADNLTII